MHDDDVGAQGRLGRGHRTEAVGHGVDPRHASGADDDLDLPADRAQAQGLLARVRAVPDHRGARDAAACYCHLPTSPIMMDLRAAEAGA